MDLGEQDGEKVVYSKYAGTELKLQGREYVILKVCALCCLKLLTCSTPHALNSSAMQCM